MWHILHSILQSLTSFQQNGWKSLNFDSSNRLIFCIFHTAISVKIQIWVVHYKVSAKLNLHSPIWFKRSVKYTCHTIFTCCGGFSVWLPGTEPSGWLQWLAFSTPTTAATNKKTPTKQPKGTKPTSSLETLERNKAQRKPAYIEDKHFFTLH